MKQEIMMVVNDYFPDCDEKKKEKFADEIEEADEFEIRDLILKYFPNTDSFRLDNLSIDISILKEESI